MGNEGLHLDFWAVELRWSRLFCPLLEYRGICSSPVCSARVSTNRSLSSPWPSITQSLESAVVIDHAKPER